MLQYLQQTPLPIALLLVAITRSLDTTAAQVPGHVTLKLLATASVLHHFHSLVTLVQLKRLATVTRLLLLAAQTSALLYLQQTQSL